LTTVHDLVEANLGTCEIFEEKQVGGERYNLLSGCPQAKTATVILRGGAQQFLDETERSLHDAIMIVRRAMKHDSVVAGGGAIEMELSKYLRGYAKTLTTMDQVFMQIMARSLEIIPRQLCDNAGFDATTILNKLRQKHASGSLWFGVDIMNEDVEDNYKACVWEPAIMKINAISAATEAACLILSIDETIKSPNSAASDMSANNPYAGGGMM